MNNYEINSCLFDKISCSDALDNERNVDTPLGGVYQSRVHFTSPSNLLMPKIESPVNSGDELSEDSTA